MATINDVFNQLVAVNGGLAQIDADVKAGSTATVQALNTLAQIDIEAVKLLFHLTQQTDTMICALEHISRNTCGILTQVTLQTQLQTRLRDDADALRDIAESVYPAAALERARLAALRAEVERCCPPPKVEPACVYEPCDQPKPVRMPDLPRINPERPR